MKNIKKPILHGLGALAYIVLLVLGASWAGPHIPEPSLLIPMVMLGLLVLSALIMGFLFLYKPLTLYLDGQKKEALLFLVETVAVFAVCVIVLIIILLALKL